MADSSLTGKRVWVPDFPEAPEKITYYTNLISELTGYETDATAYLAKITQGTKQLTVENSTSAGPYYDCFIKQKNKWFSDLAAMKSSMNSFVSIISLRISEAEVIKAEWVRKSKLGHFEVE